MTARILSGKDISAQVLESLRPAVKDLKPNLVIIQVGDNPESTSYVNQKLKACKEIGMDHELKRLPEDSSPDFLFAVINECNDAPYVTGFIVQMPLPAPLDALTQQVREMIDPKKDVDGFHPENMQKVSTGDDTGLAPATPQAVMMLLDADGIDVKGKHAVVIGRSWNLGHPLRRMLEHRGATVVVIHSKTPHPADIASKADILFAAAGSPKLVTADWVKPGAVVIDIGITRVGKELVGDVDIDAVKELASVITPVPGGVGPMTVASLLKNCVKAAERQR